VAAVVSQAVLIITNTSVGNDNEWPMVSPSTDFHIDNMLAFEEGERWRH
jgi:hypothetical protein